MEPQPLLAIACMEIAAQGHLRTRAVLRLRPFYSTSELVNFYRNQVLSFLEVFTAAIHHANDFFLASVDRVQSAFLDELGLTEEIALLEFHLAPLGARRDIAILGLLHKIALGLAPASLCNMFPSGDASFPRNLRGLGSRHTKQLRDPIDGCQSRAMTRSAFGRIYVYNQLPQDLVDATDVKPFQKRLQRGLIKACRAGVPTWRRFLYDGYTVLSVSCFRAYFDA